MVGFGTIPAVVAGRKEDASLVSFYAKDWRKIVAVRVV